MEDPMEEKLIKTKWTGLRDFVKLMKIDVIVVLVVLSITMQMVTVTQLAEDKMCINQLHQSKEYCLTLNTNHSRDKNAELVLKHASTISQWQIFITNIPATIVVAFLGFWLDKYPQYFRMMVVLPCATVCLETFMMILNCFFFEISSWALLLSYIPLGLGGGNLLIFGAAFTYIAWSTPTHLLIIRFAAVECLTQIAGLMGTYIGGYILELNPWVSGQPENYIGILSLSMVTITLALVLSSTFTFTGAREPLPENANLSHGRVLKDVFKLSRLSELFKTVARKRPNNGRIRLIMLILSATLCLASIHGEYSIGYQFAQHVYGWSAEQYTTIYSIVNIIPALLTAVGPQFLKSYLKLPDSSSGIIGTFSLFATSLIRGSILSPTGFALSYAVGSLNKVSVVSFRSLISVIVEPDEAAKIFTVITTMDCYSSLGATFIYTNVFKATIENSPGLVYIIFAIILLFPVFTCIWLEFTRASWQPAKLADVEENEEESIDEPSLLSVDGEMPNPKRKIRSTSTSSRISLVSQ